MAEDIRPYTGVWTNWSRGRVQGATLTLEQQSGAILAAALAIFVSFAGGAFWRLLTFVLHHFRSTQPRLKRGVPHHQGQVILRNSGTGAIGAAWSFAFLAFQHRAGAAKPNLSCLAFVILAASVASLFTVAGIFTSAITRVPGNTTIILGPSCGGFQTVTQESSGLVGLSQISLKAVADAYEAVSYVRQCYQQNASSLACGSYVRPSLPFSTNANASCPFAPGLCISNDQSAFSMDTGLLDSHEDFGINAPPEDRILYRKVTTCAPVNLTDFAITVGNPLNGETILVNAGNNGLISNYTFRYPVRSNIEELGYVLRAVFAPADPDGRAQGSIWAPDPLLARSDADVTLLMLAQNQILYSAPSDDPWISAHIRRNESIPFWRADYAINFLGCVDQIQVCNPEGARDPQACTSLTGQWPLLDEVEARVIADSSFFNLAQLFTFWRFLTWSNLNTIYFITLGRGAAALNAAEIVSERFSPALPANQWHKEVSTWFSTALAKEQAWAVEWATAPKHLAPASPEHPQQWAPWPPTEPESLRMCRNQLVRNPGSHTSFSVLGMALIFALGGLIIIAGLSVDTIAELILRGKGNWRIEQWMYEDVLEMHKALYQSAGVKLDAGAEVPHVSAAAESTATAESTAAPEETEKGAGDLAMSKGTDVSEVREVSEV